MRLTRKNYTAQKATISYNKKRRVGQSVALLIALVLIIGVAIVLADTYSELNSPPLYSYGYSYSYDYDNSYNYDYPREYYHGYNPQYALYYGGQYDYTSDIANEAPIYDWEDHYPSEYYSYDYIHEYENTPPLYGYDTFIDIYIVIGLPGAEFTAIADAIVNGDENAQYTTLHHKSIPACIYEANEITVPMQHGYRLVYWLSADLDYYGMLNYDYPVMIRNTYPDTDYYNYHTAYVLLTQTGGTRVYAVFMPEANESVEFGIVPFGPAPPFWVEFDANEGTLGVGQSPRITIINQPLESPPFGRIGVNFPTPPTRLGRQFVGWSIPPVGDGAAFTGSCNVYNDDLTVYARWGFEVVFNGNGMTLPAAQTSFLIPDRATGLPPHSANSSYQFAWIMRSPGSGLPPVAVPPWPEDPVRPGWIFTGWYTVAAQIGGDNFHADSPINSTLHLFARWVPTNNYTLTFVPNPPDFPTGALAPSATATRQARYGLGMLASTQTPIYLNPGYLGAGGGGTAFMRTPAVVDPSGLNFVGWWTAPGGPNGTGQFAGWGRSATSMSGAGSGYSWPAGHTSPLGSTMAILHNTPIIDTNVLFPTNNVYAYYVRRVRFNLNGAQGTFVSGVSADASGYRPESGSLGPLVMHLGAVVDFPATAPPNATVASHGRWMGINTSIPGLGPYGALSEGLLPVVPERPGFTFQGWWSTSASSGGQQFFDTTPLNGFAWGNSARRQVYARWTQNDDITLTFNANGGQWYPDQVAPARAPEFPTSIQTRTIVRDGVGTAISQWTPAVTLAVPRRPGHVFIGWYEWCDDLSAAIRFDGAAPTDRDRTFYAQWSNDVVTLTFRMDYAPSGSSVIHHVMRGLSWHDRLHMFTDTNLTPQSQVNLRPLALYNPHLIENSPGGNAPQQLVNPLGQVSTPLHRPSRPYGETTMFPRHIAQSALAISRGSLWNTGRDINGRGTGLWWDPSVPLIADEYEFFDIWQTEITFDRNHRSVVPTAYDGPNSRMTIQVPVGYSLGNRHQHPLFEYGGPGMVPTAIGPTPPPASGTTAPYFANRSDRRAWVDAPDSYTWRPRNPVSAAAVQDTHRLVNSDVIGEWAMLGWNTNPNWYQGSATGEWFDINRVLSWDNGRRYYAIWGQVVAFNIGHALAAGGVIAPEHRTRAVAFPGSWGAIEGPSQPYPIMPYPVWPGPVGFVPEFAGWNTHRDGLGTAFDRNSTITGPTHLYALWRANVYFDVNTLDPTTVGGGLVSDIIVGQTVGYVEASIPVTRTNWVFREWNYEDDASGAAFHPHTSQVDNITTVYAIWDGVVTFDPNGGTMGTPSQIGGLHHAIPEGQTIATSRQGNFVAGIATASTAWPTAGVNAWFGGMPANPTRADHSFLGWWFQDASDNWVEFTAATVMNMGNITVIARWRGPLTFSFYKTDGLATTPTGWPDLPRLPGAQFFLDQYDSTNNIYVQVAGPFTSGTDGRVNLVIPYPNWHTNGEFRLREIPPFGFMTPVYWRFTVVNTPGPAGDVITFTIEHYAPLPSGDNSPLFERGYEYVFCLEYDDYVPVFYGLFLSNRRIVVPLNVHKTGSGLISMNPPPTTLAQLNNTLLEGAVFALYRYTGPGTPASGLVPATGWVRYGNVQTSTNNPLAPMVFGVGLFHRYYQLVEISPPPGHMAPFGQWRLTLTFDTAANALTGIAVDIQGDTGTPSLERLTGEQGFVFAVGNRIEFELPLAGGSGRGLYILTGSLMLMLAVAAIVGKILFKGKLKPGLVLRIHG